MCKGADSIILPRISLSGSNESWPRKQMTVQKELLTFAKQGLRTLVIGQKILDPVEYDQLAKEHEKLKQSMAANKERKLNELYDKYEQDLTYLGSTAIEDKLQYGVPETIDMLIKANIKVWVLTGDKQETAIEIGKSCELLQPNMKIE